MDGFSMDVFGNDLLHVLLLPAWGLVTYSMNGEEGEDIVIVNEVARDLSISSPWLPVKSDFPILKGFDPSASSKSGYDTISISTPVDHLILGCVLLQKVIDPN